MKKNSLIGFSGFIGKNLLDINYFNFSNFYNSKNIEEIKNIDHDLIVCAAPSAEKWKANSHPEEDLKQVLSLIKYLKEVKTKKFILFSTIDVYSSFPCDEDVTPNIYSSCLYGKNRIILENYVLDFFPDCKIVRLPGLFGKFLKKNLIFDLINNNVYYEININDKFQWFPMIYLKNILNFINLKDEKIFNIAVEPIKNEEILNLFKTKKYTVNNKIIKNNYNMKTKFNKNGYFLSKNEVLGSLNEFIGV